MMKYCHHCAAELERNAVYCIHCGTVQQETAPGTVECENHTEEHAVGVCAVRKTGLRRLCGLGRREGILRERPASINIQTMGCCPRIQLRVRSGYDTTKYRFRRNRHEGFFIPRSCRHILAFRCETRACPGPSRTATTSTGNTPEPSTYRAIRKRVIHEPVNIRPPISNIGDAHCCRAGCHSRHPLDCDAGRLRIFSLCRRHFRIFPL